MEPIGSKFILVLFFVVIIYFVYFIGLHHETLEGSLLYKFTQFIAGFASAFIAINLYYDVAAREEDAKKKLSNDAVRLTGELWIDPNNALGRRFDNLGTLPAEMYPQLEITSKTQMEQAIMAIDIFQTFENYKVIYDQNPRELTIWLCHYLQWAQSRTLQDLWPKLMHNYKPGTIKFVNFLFKYANQLKMREGMLVASDYTNMANSIRREAEGILNNQ